MHSEGPQAGLQYTWLPVAGCCHPQRYVLPAAAIMKEVFTIEHGSDGS